MTFQRDQFWSFQMVLVALFVFALGRWGLFDLFATKRLVQISLFIAASPLIYMSLVNGTRQLRNPFILMIAIFALSELVVRNEGLGAIEFVIGGTLSAAIFSTSFRLVKVCANAVIVLAALFAFLAIVLFVVLVVEPDLVRHVSVPYTVYNISTKSVFDHPLLAFGMAVPFPKNEILGITFFRVRSFASEPSRLVVYFAIPLALALMSDGKLRKLAPIILVGLIVSFSGTGYFALLCAVIAAFILYGFRGRYFAVLFPFALLLGFSLVVTLSDSNPIVDFFGRLGASANELQILNKHHTVSGRIDRSIIVAAQLSRSPFGIGGADAEAFASSANNIFFAAGQAGVLGMILMIWVSAWFFWSSASVAIRTSLDLKTRAGAMLMYGIMLQGFLLNGGYLFASSGLILLSLVARQLTQLQQIEMDSDITTKAIQSLNTQAAPQ